MGRRVEGADPQELGLLCLDRHRGREPSVSRPIPRPRSQLPRQVGRPAVTDHVRLARQPAHDVAVHRQEGAGDHDGDEADEDHRFQTRAPCLQHRQVPVDASHRRLHHGHRAPITRSPTRMGRSGTRRTYSSPARHSFRRTPEPTRPEPSARSPTGRPRRSETATSRIRTIF